MFNILALAPQFIVMIVVWAMVVIGAIIIEFETANLVSIWFSAGGLAGLLCAIFEVPIWIQFIVFVGITLIFVIATRPFVKKISDNQTILTNADRYVGMQGVITKAIKPGEKGEIRIEFQDWPAISKNERAFEVGEKAVIIGIVGNKMIVDAIEEIKID